MMCKKTLVAILAAWMLLTLTACEMKKTTTQTPTTLPDDVPPSAEEVLDQEYTLEDDLMNQERAEGLAPNQEIIPDPPEATNYLSGLRNEYEWTDVSLEMNGTQAVYTIHVQQDNRLVDCEGSYTLILEYDGASGKWDQSDRSGWADKTYTFDLEGFEENNVWVVYPQEGISKAVYLYFDGVTEDGCYITWESMDEDITVNGAYYGEGYFPFEQGGLNGDESYPCWVADGLEIEYEFYYSGSRHKTELYYVQVRDDKVCAPRSDPFSNTSGNGVTKIVKD